VSHVWPYFLSGAERRALIANEPVPVRSCWNGVVAMDAGPFYAAQALSFWGIADGLAELHLEGSECCLIHADHPLRELKGVYVNPDVRVGYDERAYSIVNAAPVWQSTADRIKAIWKVRLAAVPARLRFVAEYMIFLPNNYKIFGGFFCWLHSGRVDRMQRSERLS
jgi:hypothetical protein